MKRRAQVQLAWREGEVFLALLENWKKVPWFFGKDALIVYIYGLNFSFKMLFNILEKNSKILPCGAFLFCAADEMFIQVRTYFKKPLFSWKIPRCTLGNAI